MQLYHVKLNNGDDLLGWGSITEDRKIIRLEDPVQIIIDPEYGFFAKSWLLLSDKKYADLHATNIMTVGHASDKAVKYYDEFKERLSGYPDPTHSESDIDDLEDLFNSLMESRNNTKH